jgi:hypothetical protein
MASTDAAPVTLSNPTEPTPQMEKLAKERRKSLLAQKRDA